MHRVNQQSCLQEHMLIGAKQKAEEAQQDLQQIQKQLAATQSNLSATQHQLEDTHTRLDSTEADVSGLEQQRRQLQQEVHALYAEAESAQHEHARLQTDITAAQGEVEKQQLQVNKLRQEGWHMEEAFNAAKRAVQRERLSATDRNALPSEHSAQSTDDSNGEAVQVLIAASPSGHTGYVRPHTTTSAKVCNADVCSACMTLTAPWSHTILDGHTWPELLQFKRL